MLKMLSKLKKKFEVMIPAYLCTRTGEGMPSLDEGIETPLGTIYVHTLKKDFIEKEPCLLSNCVQNTSFSKWRRNKCGQIKS